MVRFLMGIALLFSLFGCGLFGLKFGPGDGGPEKSEPDSALSKRRVRDTNRLVKSDPSSLKKRVVVLPFIDSDLTRPQSLRDRARESFIREVNQTAPFIAINSEEIKTDVFGLFKQGEYDLKAIAEKSRNLGFSAILEGKVLSIQILRNGDPVGIVRQLKSTYEVTIRARMIESRTGKMIFDTDKTVTVDEKEMRILQRTEEDHRLANSNSLIEDMVRDSFLEFIPQIASALDVLAWEGRIATVSGERVYVNVGQDSGLQIGDLLRVSDGGEEVFDPEHGSFIGKVPGRIKGTLEVISFFGRDGSIATIHSGSGFRENDRVELY